MAKSTVIVTRDDWTGDIVEATDIAPKQITTFSFNGREYSLDLSMASADELQAVLAPWMEKASNVNVVGRRARQARTGGRQSEETTSEGRTDIREWARRNGFDIGPRGRIPEVIVQAYQDRDDTLQEPVDDEYSGPESEANVSAVTVDAGPAVEAEQEHVGDESKPTVAERAAIRQWALAQGRDVKSRGPLSPELIRDYRQAHAAA
ncbi:Lsr2 dimerization domain-containing protein [Nocardia noduli]|uniref:Lsr2 dimerization domain-containing protein n=1 Tax=Nocardia noduli TaxID=2815722 RepID=UPI001C216EE1|nr:histone-like nucleoid-structuring protein Lsr2 [Nocardia noduli]